MGYKDRLKKGSRKKRVRINHSSDVLKQHLETKVILAKSSSHIELGAK